MPQHDEGSLDAEIAHLVWKDWVISCRIADAVGGIAERVVRGSAQASKELLDGRPGIATRPSMNLARWEWTLQVDTQSGTRLGQVVFGLADRDVDQVTARVKLALLQSSPFGGPLEDARKRAHAFMEEKGWPASFSRVNLGRNDLAIRSITASELNPEDGASAERFIELMVAQVSDAVAKFGTLFERWAVELAATPGDVPPGDTTGENAP